MGSKPGSAKGVPPGFRFHPTDEELLGFYLRKKTTFQKLEMEVIREVDLNSVEPWDLQEKCGIGSAPQNEWYFFSHKDKKYPTGSRTNRATKAGFWKATGRDKCIRSNGQKIGMRKTLVFYRGRAPRGLKTDWIMHEYRLEEDDEPKSDYSWVVCRVSKKKTCFKPGNGAVSQQQIHGITNLYRALQPPSMQALSFGVIQLQTLVPKVQGFGFSSLGIGVEDAQRVSCHETREVELEMGISEQDEGRRGLEVRDAAMSSHEQRRKRNGTLMYELPQLHLRGEMDFLGYGKSKWVD